MYEEQVVIYSDLLFVVNLVCDYLVLYIVSSILNRKRVWWRLGLGATVGGIYAFVPFILDTYTLFEVILHLLCAGLICVISFGFFGIWDFLKDLGSFIIGTALLGGLVSACYGVAGDYGLGVYGEVEMLDFFVILFISALVAFLYAIICKKKLHSQSVALRIYDGGYKMDFRLLCDSGNLVTEPFSAKPVIIVSSTSLPFPYDKPQGDKFPKQLRVIPFSTTAGVGCYFGFLPEKAEILRAGKKPKPIDAYIAIDEQAVSYSGYDGIFPTSLI